MIYEILINKEAGKYLKKLDQPTRSRINFALEGLTLDPPVGDIAPMKGMPGYYRLRIGSYRAVFVANHEEKKIYVRAIGSRGSVY